MQYGKSNSVWLSLGSNMKSREDNLLRALNALDTHSEIRICKKSDWFETEPWGLTDQSAFLNMVVEIGTELAPLELLNAVKSIERELGRQAGTRWGPRLIDIDIVVFGDCVLDTPELTVPHKRFRERAFVLVPMALIAGDIIDPVTQMTIAELATRPEAAGKVQRFIPAHQHNGSE